MDLYYVPPHLILDFILPDIAESARQTGQYREFLQLAVKSSPEIIRDVEITIYCSLLLTPQLLKRDRIEIKSVLGKFNVEIIIDIIEGGFPIHRIKQYLRGLYHIDDLTILNRGAISTLFLDICRQHLDNILISRRCISTSISLLVSKIKDRLHNLSSRELKLAATTLLDFSRRRNKYPYQNCKPIIARWLEINRDSQLIDEFKLEIYRHLSHRGRISKKYMSLINNCRMTKYINHKGEFSLNG